MQNKIYNTIFENIIFLFFIFWKIRKLIIEYIKFEKPKEKYIIIIFIKTYKIKIKSFYSYIFLREKYI